MHDAYGTVWYVETPDGVGVPVDPDREFGWDWPGHAADEEPTD